MARFIDKLTSTAERIAHRLPAVPIIVEAKPDRFSSVLGAIRGYLSEGRFGGIISHVTELFPTLRTIPTFNYIATVLPREWVFDLADAAEVRKIYPNTLKYALSYPIVPSEGVFEYEKGAFKEVEPFTTTYYTKKAIGADIATQKGYAGTGIRVAVADTGVSRRHPATRHMMLDSAMMQVHDENGHGEWCCACIGGRYVEDVRLGRILGTKIPTEGIAPNAVVVGIKCLGYLIGTGSDDAVIKAIELGYYKYYADVISMSLGGPIQAEKQEDDPYYRVVKEITARGTVFCVAAGNEGPGESTVGSPGWLEDVLTVGAYNPLTGEVADFSSRGPTPDDRIKPDCVAPGVRVHAPIVGWLDRAGDNMNNQFSPLDGTSMATPHVSGLVALMKEAHSRTIGRVLTTDEINKMLSELGHEKNNDAGWGALTWEMYEEWMSTQYGVEL